MREPKKIMTDDVFYDEMNADDIPAVARLECECFSDPWSPASLETTLKDKNSAFLVARSDGKVVGYIGMLLVLDEGQILNVAVSADMRRRGIGRRLIQEMTALGISRGLRFFTLEVREGNLPAICLYEGLGFRKTGRRPDYYTKPCEAAVLMDLTVS